MPMRRTIAEWMTLLELEPTLRFVFVEGDSDQWLISTLFRSLNSSNVSVVKIDEVVVPARMIPNSPFSSGNRARLLALAAAVELGMSRPVDNLRCVVDCDLATLIPMAGESRFVRFTDCANILICFAEFYQIQHMIGAVYGHELSLDDYSAITGAAQFIFASRAVTYGAYPAAKRVDPYASVKLSEDRLLFDGSDYVRRFSLANGISRDGERIFDQINVLRARFGDDARKYMNYHDFLSLLYGGLKRRRFVRAGVTQAEIGRVFLATISVERMLQIPLLEELVVWVSSG
jgi:hypothetical protein